MFDEKDFELLDESPKAGEIIEDADISQDDFVLTQVDSTVHEQKFQTKPTTFLKDSIKRFGKNKSSVVAAYILGALLLMSFIVPLVDPSNTKGAHQYETYLAPKLFKAGTGFWDGSVKYSNIAVDLSEMPDAKTEEEKQLYWWPSSQKFPQRSAISKKKFTEEKYSNDISNLGTFGKEGYIHFGFYETEANDYVAFSSKTMNALVLDSDLYLTSFDTYDVAKIREKEGKDYFNAPDNYVIGESAFYFLYSEQNSVTGELEQKEVKLVDYKTVHNIGSGVERLKEEKINIGDKIKTETGKDEFLNASFSVRMNVDHEHKKNTCALIRSITFESTSASENVQNMFNDMSFTDATSALTKSINDGYEYWSSTGVRRIYLSKAHFCSFVYDTYEAAFGERMKEGEFVSDLLTYEEKGWISFKDQYGIESVWKDDSGYFIDRDNYAFKILDKVNCPLSRDITVDDFYGDDVFGTLGVKFYVYQYKYLGYKNPPIYLMGTDKSGKDMFKYVFEGLRTSLLLGVLTFAVCFSFGLLWGSICGYFGGTVDLVMERLTDILSGIPWIVVMTLIILHFGSNFWTFALALCLTGWIGTAARTRTQFYRFRGREYVLASRTLGASDARLIAKHILPNALGTIITGAVLMIPSVIFSEATISYLGLGLKNTSSLGVVLSDNQAELLTNPYLLIFPAIVIALIMISFNLFGNGLRDAINPSLKGED